MLPYYDGNLRKLLFCNTERNASPMKQFHIACDVTRRHQAHLPLPPYLIAAVLGALQTESGGNHAASSALCASFDLVAFGTCPYQPRIQLHTQSHKHASKITKYHLLLSCDPLSVYSLFLSLARARPSALLFLLTFPLFARSRNLRARVHRWVLMATT